MRRGGLWLLGKRYQLYNMCIYFERWQPGTVQTFVEFLMESAFDMEMFEMLLQRAELIFHQKLHIFLLQKKRQIKLQTTVRKSVYASMLIFFIYTHNNRCY